MISRCYSCMNRYDFEYEVCPHCGYIASSLPKELYHLYPGTILQGRYIIGRVVDYGGFGTVYKAWDNVLQIVVAVKEYYPAGIVQRVPQTSNVIVLEGHREEYRKGLDRFLEEAVNTAKFEENENIINVHTFFELNNTAYIIMEYLDGCSLSSYLEKYGKMSGNVAVNVLLSIIKALKSVHKEKLVHRDISPSNIFLCKNGCVKLIDFGAARSFDDNNDMDIEIKPGYAPPEQYSTNGKLGPWTDIYALGATLYKTITAEIPEESINRLDKDDLKRPKSIDDSIPKYLDKTLMRAMAISPELRFQSVDDFEKAIQNKRRVKTPEKELKKRKRRRFAIITVISILVLAAFVYSYVRYRIEKMNSELPETTIDIWMMADTVSERQYKKQKFEDLCEEFKKDNPQVSFNYTFYNSREYADRVTEASVIGDTPDLFEPAGIPDHVLLFAALSPDDLYELITPEDYYVLNAQKDSIFETRRVPIGFNVKVAVSNSELSTSLVRPLENSPELFMNGKNATAYLDLKDYYTVQNNQEFVCTVKPKPFVDYSYEWCIGYDTNLVEKTCAVRVLYYLLGDSAQEKMYTVYEENIPLKKDIASGFFQTNPTFDFIEENLELEECPEHMDFDEAYKELFK